jgi:molecular chaperone GrpE
MVDEKTQVPGAEPKNGEELGEDVEGGVEVTMDTEAVLPEAEPNEAIAANAEAQEIDYEAKLAAAETKANDNYDRMLRVLAEFENYKKRSVKEMADFRKFANENFARDILGVLDNLERAIKSSADDEESSHCVVAGVEMILKDLVRILEKFSVTPIQAVGKPFDPLYHQAVSQVPSKDHKPNTVIQEFQKGYMIHDRLLRPSMVVVSKAEEPIGQE